MNGHDESRLDSIAVLAIGALPAAEARELEAHIASCSICQAEYAEFREAVDALALSAEATPEEFGGARCDLLKERVMNVVRTDAARANPAGEANVVSLEARRARTPWWIPAIAAAAVVIAAVSTWNAAVLRTRTDDLGHQVALLQAQVNTQESSANEARAQLALEQSHLADLVAPDAARFPISSGVVVRGDGRIVVALRRLPPPPSGKTYQAWILHRGAKAMTPSITFSPDPSGLALIELPGSAAGITTIAVSVEPIGGSKAPTSKPLFVRSLS
jgi:cell division protein FtsB